MKQAEKHKSKYVPQVWPANQTDVRDSPELCWKYIQKKNQSTPPTRTNRSPSMEPVASYYSTTNSYKPFKNHAYSSPTYSKYTSPCNFDTPHQSLYSHVRPNKETRYSSNVAIIRNNCYDENVENNDKRRYINEELDNFTEDNVEEDGEEEVEDDQEEAGEFLDKDYEEHEADDEIDEESDTYPQIHRAQCENKKEGTYRSQQPWKHSEQQQQLRRPRYQQYNPSRREHSIAGRYYHNATEYDIPEPLMGEHFAENPMSTKHPSRRSPSDYHHWIQSRSSTDRYDTRLPGHTTRRTRTKPETNPSIDNEFNKVKRCSRCGSVSNKNTSSSSRNNCRLDDRFHFPTKGPIGDDAEVQEQTFCGRCNFKHDTENVRVDYNFPTPSAYSTKARRIRDVKSPKHEPSEQGHMTEKMSKDYAQIPARYSKDVTNMLDEKAKRSVHATHGSARTTSRYAE